MRGWSDLGVVDTIYEDEHEDSSPSLSPTSFQPWSMVSRGEADVLIYIQGLSFHLHKDPLSSRSGYLKRQLSVTSELTLSPPLNLTPDTFALVVDFCYGADVVITPFNLAALRTAAELLEMTETNGAGDENLRQKTEGYFRHEVVGNGEYASVVLRSCLKLLPEAETTASLVSRCIEALNLTDDGDGILGFIDDVITLSPKDFEVVARALRCRLTESHDLIYRLIDFYLKEHKGKLTDDQKTGICNCMDCTRLSPQILMHAVQNPKLPLRFIVQAMFIEQLNTRRSIVSSVANHKPHNHDHDHDHDHDQKDTVTLGVILQRDAALRQAAQLRAAMDATTSRIQGLEKELEGMKRLLGGAEVDAGGARSASFRFSWERRKGGVVETCSTCSDEEGFRVEKSSNNSSFGRKLMSGLKSVFRAKSKDKFGGEKRLGLNQTKGGNNIGDHDDGNESVIVIKKDVPFHKRSHSFQ